MADPRDNTGRGGRYYGPPPDEPSPNRPPQIRRKPRKLTPQDAVQQYWVKLDSKYPGKVFTILPNNPYARKKAAKIPHGTVHGQRAAKSYEESRAECTKDVDRIIKECRRLNQKYRDPHFDIEWDLKSKNRNWSVCLSGSADRQILLLRRTLRLRTDMRTRKLQSGWSQYNWRRNEAERRQEGYSM